MAVFDLSRDMMRNAYIIAQCTNRLVVDRLENLTDSDIDNMGSHGFDVRVFNDLQEIRYFRPDIEADFIRREIRDEADSDSVRPGSGEDYYDEWQYLDIDDERTKDLPGTQVIATGGGVYNLPLADVKDAKICIRNYLNYEKDTGRAYVSDWRCVGFNKERR